MFYSSEIVETVRQANPIKDVVSQHIQLRNNKGLCPFHDDKNPSFSVHPQKEIARCFVCMSNAVDVFGFIMLMKKVTFPEAVKILADRSGVELPNFSEEDKQSLEKQKRRGLILKDTALFYHNQLMLVMTMINGKEAL